MLPITTIAPVPGPLGLPIVLGYHTFQRGDDGQLEHYIDGELRAVVPPEGWEGYARDWPQCADLVAQLRRPVQRSPLEIADAVSALRAAAAKL